MIVDILTLPPVRIATLRKLGPYGPEIGHFWSETVRPWLGQAGLLGEPTCGIARDDPASTPPDACRYDAGVEVGQGFTVPPGAGMARLDGGLYAVARFAGHAHEIPLAWEALWRDWLPGSGHAADLGHENRPAMEYYPRAWRMVEDGSFACELRLPVKPA